MIDSPEQDEDWRDNTVEPVISAEEKAKQEKEEEVKEQAMKMAAKSEDESIEFSQNLVKVYERRYARLPMTTDIVEYVKEYFTLAVAAGNHFQNTKYCLLYMLKTHKHRFDLFKLIHGSKSLAEQAKHLGLESLFEGLS